MPLWPACSRVTQLGYSTDRNGKKVWTADVRIAMYMPIRIESADDVALSSMRDHHVQLRADLQSRLAALQEAFAAGAPFESAQAALTEFVDGALLPHAAAQAESLYPVAADHGLGVFIDAMVLEHRELEHHAQALRSAATAVRALGIGEAIAAVFAV